MKIYGGKNVKPHPNPILAAHRMSETFLDRFWQKVTKTDSCWIWNGSRTQKGHGEIGRGLQRDGLIRAHVASWIIHNGSIPKGKCVLHNCPGGDNPACVNPKHLWIGTVAENNTDAANKQRFPLGDKHWATKLNWEKVNEIRKMHANGVGIGKLGRTFGVNYMTIKACVLHKTWKWNPNHQTSISSIS